MARFFQRKKCAITSTVWEGAIWWMLTR